jgi:hypothetical protein
VPRAWTLYFAEMAGVEVPDQLPEDWIVEARKSAGGEVPTTFSELAVDLA